jgi:TonB family protein
MPQHPLVQLGKITTSEGGRPETFAVVEDFFPSSVLEGKRFLLLREESSGSETPLPAALVDLWVARRVERERVPLLAALINPTLTYPHDYRLDLRARFYKAMGAVILSYPVLTGIWLAWLQAEFGRPQQEPVRWTEAVAVPTLFWALIATIAVFVFLFEHLRTRAQRKWLIEFPTYGRWNTLQDPPRDSLLSRRGSAIFCAVLLYGLAFGIGESWREAWLYLRSPAGRRLQPGPATERPPSAVVHSTSAADLSNMLGGISPLPPPPPPPGADPPSPRVSKGRIPKVLKRVAPIYPPLARQAGIEGLVVFRVDVGMDGRPENVHLISGHPLLVPYASDAVQQWEFEKPAAPVSTQVELRFSLQ